MVELSLEFQGLQISIRGNFAASVDFVRQVAGLQGGLVSTSSSVPASSWSLVGSSPRQSVPETRASIEASFPVIPAHFRLLSSDLGSSSLRISAEDRIQRVWTAGCWVKAKLQGRVQSPNRTPVIDLGNKAYAVIRRPGIDSPRIFNTSRELFSAVGELAGSDTICHGFPSKAEARAYITATEDGALQSSQ